MNYIGSKLKLSNWIKEEIIKTVGQLEGAVFCDIFAGTGIIGRSLKTSVGKVIANDIEPYAFALNRNYIGNHFKIEQASIMLDELNALQGVDGFIFHHYSLGGSGNRQYFSGENG